MQNYIFSDFGLEITRKLCELGKKQKHVYPLSKVEPFKDYFLGDQLKYDSLDLLDGRFTRREILTRYLLVNTVLDQGPDPEGVAILLRDVTVSLYGRGIRIFHEVLDFFKAIDISIGEIISKHEAVKKVRKNDWARKMKSTPSKYNLFFAQSTRGIVPSHQALDYTIHRIGVPLCLFLLLEKDPPRASQPPIEKYLEGCRGEEIARQKEQSRASQPLIEYLESFKSAEEMARQLKDHPKYGLGSAIGDKACHLFAKLYVGTYKLVRSTKEGDKGWTGISYEAPFDSNAGRVLFRTGFLLEWATLKEYKKSGVIQIGKGKGETSRGKKTNYIRVTNIRGMNANIPLTPFYIELVTEYFKVGSRPRTVKIQRIPNLIIHELNQKGYEYSIADFDDGLMHVGTQYCFNHENPACNKCPLREMCRGCTQDPRLIEEYRT
jgi:hypothetical protein